MSGTSLDGIDLCFTKFENGSDTFFKILHTKEIKYGIQLRERLRNSTNLTALDFIKLDTDLGKHFAEEINTFIEEKNISTIDAIASHGHTIFHNPGCGYSTQIGNPAIIHAKTGIKTIADFRSIDVALGGQGAPLVPIGDRDLFQNHNFRLNLGGIANVSYEEEGKTMAFDIVFCNMILNSIAEELGLEYDENGGLAASGLIDSDMLNRLKSQSNKGKLSLGFEGFEKKIKSIITDTTIKVEDRLATCTEFIASEIGKVLTYGNTLISGGGAFNKFLISRLRVYSKSEIVLPDPEIINFKEALIFAYLGYLRLRSEKNTLKTVTKAKRDSIGGCIYG